MQKRRQLNQELEARRAERNQWAKNVGQLRQQNVTGNALDTALENGRQIGQVVSKLEAQFEELEAQFREQALALPNLLDEAVPNGQSEAQNLEVKRVGEPSTYDFSPRDHLELGEALGIIDLTRAAKMAGARFGVLRQAGAHLERALSQWMLEVHTQEHGYEEIAVPLLVNAASMQASGQLPKFAEDLFRTDHAQAHLYLIPTAEVPLVSLHREEILERTDLPRRYTAYSPCFRREAGAYGKDTRGLIRQHQFNKVELVQLVEPESSMAALDEIVRQAETILQRLELPYRIVQLCSGDTGFGASLTYDLEVYLPSTGHYREISSCSNCKDFQARRAQVRYRPAAGAKPASSTRSMVRH